MNTQIKRIFAKILLYFLLFSFIFVTLYMNEVSLQQDKLYKCGNTENTYKIALTTELDDNDIFMTMQPVLDKYRANLTLLISEKTEYATIMTEYVYLSEPAFDDLILRSGRLLDASDNCSNVYVSSDDNSDENQNGIIDIFPCDTVFTIMPISDESMPENLFNRYIRLSLQNADDYTKITEDFAACGIYITEDTSEIPDSTVNFYIFFVPVFFIIVFVSLSLYEILNSYKSIAVKKLLGYSDFQIYLRYIAVSAVCMALSALLSLIICSLFSNINILSISCVKFIFNILAYDLLAVFALLIVISIPFTYIPKIRPSEMLRNRKPVMAVNIINFVFKVAIGVIVVNLLSSLVSSYNVIDSFAQDRFSNWMTTQNYYVVSKFRNSYEDPWDPQLREASYNSYCQLNENGAILADFYNYTDYVYSANMDLHDGVPYKSAWATINPNYLELFTVYDEDGVAVKVSETENKMVILIPCKYKEASGEISEYYEKVFSKDIQIIWLKEGQSVFSYSIDINPSNGNCVKDPILVVLTLENTSVDNWHYLDGYMGEPIKIKALSDNINARDEILTVFYSHYDEEKCTLTLSNIYDSVETDIYQIKVTAYWILGICAAFSVLLITVILQCLYLYFEERKQSIAVMYILGHSIFKRYSKLFEDVLASWIAILLIGMVIGNAVLIIYISSAGLLLELLGLLICIRCSEQKKIINVLKNE